MKVVINSEYGGFGLSDWALEKLLERKKIPFEKKNDKKYGMVHYYRAGHLDDPDFYLSHYDLIESRADPDLIAVVEELGKNANSEHSSLSIIEIPDDVEWHIGEYDGCEWVAENHRTWP